MIALAFLICPYPPMTDHPQHVAMGALLNLLWSGDLAATSTYTTSPFTYNAGIETGIALLAFVMSPELAGRVILAIHVLVFAASLIALCDYANRPRWYALLCIPIIYNHVTGWGFSNFVVAFPLMILASVGWMRIVDGARKWWLSTGVVAASMMVAYTHVLVMLCLCVVVAVVSLDVLLSRKQGILKLASQLVVPGLLLVPSVGYSLGAWFWARATSTVVWEHSWAEGQDAPLWQKLKVVLFNATGNFADGSDQYFLLAVVILGVVMWTVGGNPAHPRMRRLAITFACLYLVIPDVFIATFHIYQRFLPFAALFAMAAIPVAAPAASSDTHADEKGNRGIVSIAPLAAAVLALLTGANLLYRFVTIPELDDALSIIDDAPVGKSLAGVTFDPKVSTFNREIWVHLPALYQARKQGVLGYSFLRNESVPVHYLPGKEPRRPPGGFEWDGHHYDFGAGYARDYDLVLVLQKVGEQGTLVNPAPMVFQGWDDKVRLLSRRGRFFLFDASEANQVLR